MDKEKSIHIKFMKRCLELALQGLGQTYPNPLVGCVLVYKNNIVSEGWHKKKGEPHAEVLAIQGLKDKSLLSQCTLYVNLEPCNHQGATPPCSDLIIKYNIPKVVIGCKDPFKLVNGSGIEKLQSNGCEVILGVLKKESQELNKRFFTYHLKKRPYIILKWAQSSDGFLAPLPQNRNAKKTVWLSSSSSQTLSHLWRSQEQSILVGVQTIVDDNPSLTVRKVKEKRDFLRIILDPQGRIPKKATVLSDKYNTLVFSKKELAIEKQVYISDFKNILNDVLTVLYKKNIQSIIIEGGAKTIEYFLNEDLWEEARIFYTPAILKEGIKAPKIKGKQKKEFSVENDRVLILVPHL